MAYNSLMVFTGNANPKLAVDVATQLNVDLGGANVGRFSDGEVSVELQEHVRGRDICRQPWVGIAGEDHQAVVGHFHFPPGISDTQLARHNEIRAGL